MCDCQRLLDPDHQTLCVACRRGFRTWQGYSSHGLKRSRQDPCAPSGAVVLGDSALACEAQHQPLSNSPSEAICACRGKGRVARCPSESKLLRQSVSLLSPSLLQRLSSPRLPGFEISKQLPTSPLSCSGGKYWPAKQKMTHTRARGQQNPSAGRPHRLPQ